MAKQRRFDAFLQSEGAARALARSAGLPAKEAAAELVEFGKVAAFFSRPTHSVISDRFTSTTVEQAEPPRGLSRPSGSGGGDSSGGSQAAGRDATAPTDQHAAAAELGMFGKLTRIVTPWQPEALLCKRFNVPLPQIGPGGGRLASSATFDDALLPLTQIFNPTASGQLSGQLTEQQRPHGAPKPTMSAPPAAQQASAQEQAAMLLQSLQPPPQPPPPPPPPGSGIATAIPGPSSGPIPGLAQARDPPRDPPKEELPAEARPPLDLFRAIFEDSDDEVEAPAAPKPPPSPPPPPPPPSLASARAPSAIDLQPPPRAFSAARLDVRAAGGGTREEVGGAAERVADVQVDGVDGGRTGGMEGGMVAVESGDSAESGSSGESDADSIAEGFAVARGSGGVVGGEPDGGGRRKRKVHKEETSGRERGGKDKKEKKSKKEKREKKDKHKHKHKHKKSRH